MRTFLWLVMLSLSSACQPEGLSVRSAGPLAVGSYDLLFIERCLKHSALGPGPEVYPCRQFDTLTNLRVTSGDEAVLHVGPVTDTHVRLDVLAAGVTRVSVSATGGSGEALETSLEVESRVPARHVVSCLYGDHLGCTPELAWVQGRRQQLEDLPIFDETGAPLGGFVDYEASGSLSTDGGIGALVVTASGVGEGTVAPVSPVMRAATTEVKVEVVPASAVVALRFATALADDAGVVRLPPPLLPGVVSRPELPDGGAGVFRANVFPVLELADGGWARPELEELSVVGDGGQQPLSCSREPCRLWLDQPAVVTFGWRDAVQTTLTVQ